jgi:hypothetical protein
MHKEKYVSRPCKKKWKDAQTLWIPGINSSGGRRKELEGGTPQIFFLRTPQIVKNLCIMKNKHSSISLDYLDQRTMVDCPWFQLLLRSSITAVVLNLQPALHWYYRCSEDGTIMHSVGRAWKYWLTKRKKLFQMEQQIYIWLLQETRTR